MAFFNWLTQVFAVTLTAVRTIPQRKGASLATVTGIAGVVAVLIAVLSIAFVVRTRAREERVRWARAALSDISRLNDEGDIVGMVWDPTKRLLGDRFSKDEHEARLTELT